ncbi:MAG: glycosyltransferase family 4 protein [Cyanobacteria bacterium P01_F01_bin.56]
MKIAVIGAKGLPPRQGGIEHYCAEVYPRMVAQGHTVDLYARTSYTEAPWFQNNVFKGVNVISLPGPRGGVDALTTSALGALAAWRSPYDIIHFHALGPALFSGISKPGKAKVVVTCHGLDWQRAKWSGSASWLIRAGERAAVAWADELVVVSSELQSYFLKTYDQPTTHITTAPASYAAADPSFQYGRSLGIERERYIVFLGRLVPEKKPDLLIQAFQKLQPKGWKLVLVGGESGAEAYLEELFALATNNSSIVFAGELRGAHLAEIVQGAGLFVLPSDLEGLPMSLLEAMREGIPAIASDISPHRQMLDSDRGVLFSVGDCEACYQALKLAIADPEAMAKRAQAAAHYVRTHHNWDCIARENLDVYEQSLNPSRRRFVVSQD